jgi:hypothetical protein
MTGRGPEDARNTIVPSDDQRGLPDGIPFAGGAAAGLAIGQPNEALIVDGLDDESDFVGVALDQESRAVAWDAGKHVADRLRHDLCPGTRPAFTAPGENRFLLPSGSGYLHQFDERFGERIHDVFIPISRSFPNALERER